MARTVAARARVAQSVYIGPKTLKHCGLRFRRCSVNRKHTVGNEDKSQNLEHQSIDLFNSAIVEPMQRSDGGLSVRICSAKSVEN